MPARERSYHVDERGLGGDPSYNQRQHREAMARKTSPKTSPQGSNPRADVQPSQWDDADWDQDHDEAAGYRARRLLSRSNSGFHRLGDRFGSLRRWVAGRTLGQAPRRRHRGSAGDLRRLLRRAVVAARRRSDQSRYGHALAGGGDRGKYRPRQYRRGRRHPDRARRANPHRRPHPRYHRQGSRPRHRRQRAEGRGEAFRHRAADGTASRREPQSGRCRTRGSHHAGWQRHGFRRRHRQAARHRRGFEEGRRAGADISASDPGAPQPLGTAAPLARRRIRARSPTPRKADCSPASTGSTA